MLKARTITDALALYCSDMLNGIYSLEEMADTMDLNVVSTEEGDYQLVNEEGELTSVIEVMPNKIPERDPNQEQDLYYVKDLIKILNE